MLQHNSLGRMTRVDQTGNGGATVANKRVDFTYNSLDQFSTITRQVKPSSTWDEVATSTFTYDTRNRLTALDHKHSTTDIANYDWTYDAMDRVLQFSGPDGTSDYTYDKESQVTATDHSFQTDESYSYTATGNRTGGGYSVASNNRMTSDGTYNYTYDDEGNCLTRTKISDSSLTEYTWDHRNRLAKVVERAAGVGQPITKQTDYKYDIFDRRISKSYDADGAGGGSAVVSRFVYDGNHIALQFDGSNNLTHRYLHGPAIDQILADEDASNDILWPLTDNLGTVRDLVDDSGAVQNHLEYDTFGQITDESNAAVDHIFAYTGRERDEETGLNYYRKRYYDPAAGRFLSHDPSGFAAGDPNLSRYVSNNSTNMVDPYGLQEYTPPPNPGSPPTNDYNSAEYREWMLANAVWMAYLGATSAPASGSGNSSWTWGNVATAVGSALISPPMPGGWNPIADPYIIATNPIAAGTAGVSQYYTGLYNVVNGGAVQPVLAGTDLVRLQMEMYWNFTLGQGGLGITENMDTPMLSQYSAAIEQHYQNGGSYAGIALPSAGFSLFNTGTFGMGGTAFGYWEWLTTGDATAWQEAAGVQLAIALLATQTSSPNPLSMEFEIGEGVEFITPPPNGYPPIQIYPPNNFPGRGLTGFPPIDGNWPPPPPAF